MTEVVHTCPYHDNVVIPDKFSPCPKCVDEFFRKHGIVSEKYILSDMASLGGGSFEEVMELSVEDIIVELDDILEKEK